MIIPENILSPLLISLAVFVAIVLGKMLYNIHYWFLAKNVFKKYEKNIEDEKSWYVTENRQVIVKIFKKAGIKDHQVPVSEPTGGGYMQVGNISYFENIHMRKQDIVNFVYADLKESIAVYRRRSWEGFSPIYWIEFILFLPKHILSYVGVSTENVAVKVTQVFYWLVSIAASIATIASYIRQN